MSISYYVNIYPMGTYESSGSMNLEEFIEDISDHMDERIYTVTSAGYYANDKEVPFSENGISQINSKLYNSWNYRELANKWAREDQRYHGALYRDSYYF